MNFVHLDDAVKILITVASQPEMRNEGFISSDANPASFKEFVTYIAQLLGAKIPGSVPLLLAKAVVGNDLIRMLTRSIKASNEKISKFYGFEFPDYMVGIQDIVRKYKADKQHFSSV